MVTYKVVEPCIYAVGDKVVHHTEPGAVVELDDDTARGLGDAVEFVKFVEKVEPGAFRKTARRGKSKPEGDGEQQ